MLVANCDEAPISVANRPQIPIPRNAATEANYSTPGTGVKQAGPTNTMYEPPSVEKYRPSTLKVVVGNHDVLDRLRIVAKKGYRPNLLLMGLPSCGKMTAIMALARELLTARF